MDGDAFFVGVEIAKNPKLLGLPVVTGEERGIVTALSYEAKAMGITRGFPIFKLKKEFPKVLILPGDYKSYEEYSTKMFDIVRRYADEVEEYSIDECFAELTGLDKPLKMSYREIAERIKLEINNELKLSISIGLGPTKCLSKVASKWEKPDGLTVIEIPSIKDFLSKTPIEKIWGIGRRTSEFLKLWKINTAGEFADKSLPWIKGNLSKPYQVIWYELNGVSILKVDPERKTTYSSVQKTRTFYPPTNDSVFLLSQISKHLEEACRKVRHYNLVPKKISFFLKSQEFRYYSFEVVLEAPTNTPEGLIVLARKYFNNIYRKNTFYRATGVSLYELVPEEVKQGDLFGGMITTNKFETIHKQIDSLEKKFGKRVIHLASSHNAKKIKTKGSDSEDLNRDLLFL